MKGETQIEVVALKGKRVSKKNMSIYDFQKLKKIKGWKYKTYQIGFCQIKATE